MKVRTIGILGAGKLGVVLSRLALKAGYEVLIAGSGSPEKIALSTKVLTPGAVALSAGDVAKQADVIVLALPLGKFRNLSPDLLANKLTIDAMNWWWEVDGDKTDIVADGLTSSEAVQQFFAKSRVVKAFNHMGYHDLFDEARPKGQPGRKAIAVAGDDEADVEIVMELVDALGFDPLSIGKLSQTVQLEAGGAAFGANETVEQLKKLLGVE